MKNQTLNKSRVTHLNGVSRVNTGTSAIVELTKEINSKALNLGGFKMESFGTADDTVSGTALSAIKSTLKAAGFGGFCGKTSKVWQPGDHLRNSVKFEDAAEPESATDDTQNEEILLTEAQEKAGVQAAAMADKPAEWAKTSVNLMNEAQAINNTEDGVEFSARVKMEAYDDQNYRDAVGYSVVWNIVAARQSNAVENIWPTITLEPNQSHVEAIVQFQVFHPEVRHKSTGDRTDFGRILLLETIINGELLDEDIIKCVPVYEKDLSDHHFVDPTEIAHRVIQVEGEDVTTGPLLPGVEHNLLGLSQAAIANLQGELNSSAQLAPMPKLENLYVRVEDKAGKVSYILYPASRLNRASFTANLEGNIRDIMLNCILNQLSLDANTVDVTGAPAEALAFLRTPELKNHRIEYTMKIHGDGNLETGNMEIQPATGKINGIQFQQALGHYASEKDKTVKDEIIGNIKSITLKCFDVDASRTNIDRQQRGPLTNVTAEFQKYYVKLRSPISTIFPATEAQSNVDLVSPMTATRIKNDFYGIRSLYQYADILAGQVISEDVSVNHDDLKAIGKFIMKPYYKHVTISMLDILDSNRSKHKLEDMQHAFLNYVRDLLIHGMRDSRYELALQVQTGSAETKPTIAMITNQVLGKYLFQLGDTRILGSLPYPVVADTHASKLLGEYYTDEHELFMVPTLPGTQLNPLNWGHHLWKPELASTLQVTRDNATNREVVVQACNDWHMICPWMIRITVTDVTHAMTSKTPLAVLV